MFNGGENRIFLGDGNDVVKTFAGDNLIVSGGGNDVIKTAGGDDNIFAGDGDDELVVVGGHNYMNGGALTRLKRACFRFYMLVPVYFKLCS